MELRHLRYFAAVAETLNYRAASGRLNLSAPALSKQVRDLEEELGVRLFDRDTTRVRLPTAGQVFLSEARALIAHADRAMTLAREAAKGQRGRLVIGNVGPLTAGYMAEAVTAFWKRFPDVEVELADVELPEQISALERREINVGFTTPRLIDAAGLSEDYEHVRVLTTPVSVAMSTEHPLAAQRTVSFAQLARERLLCVMSARSRSSHRGYIEELLAARGMTPARVNEVRGFESLLALVASGQGVSVLAGRASVLRVEGIVLRPFKDAGSDCEVNLHAVWCRRTAGAVAENFIAEFRRLSRVNTEGATAKSAPKRKSQRTER